MATRMSRTESNPKQRIDDSRWRRHSRAAGWHARKARLERTTGGRSCRSRRRNRVQPLQFRATEPYKIANCTSITERVQVQAQAGQQRQQAAIAKLLLLHKQEIYQVWVSKTFLKCLLWSWFRSTSAPNKLPRIDSAEAPLPLQGVTAVTGVMTICRSFKIKFCTKYS